MEATLTRTALVTGGSRGIGRAVSERLAAEGYLVAVHYGNNSAAAATTVQAVSDAGGEAFAIGQPLGDADDAASLFSKLDEQLMSRTGNSGINVLINNAGIAGESSLTQTTQEWYDELFAVNARVPFFVTRQARDRLRDAGRVVNVTTGLTKSGDPALLAYAMSKAPIEVMTRILAKELGPRGITVNAVAPGATDTDMNASWLRDSPEAQAQVASMSPFGRVGTVDDVADVVMLAASEQARWLTGQWLDATGGALL